MLREVRVRPHHALRSEQHPCEERHIGQSNLSRPIAPGLVSAEIQDRAAPRFAIELEESPGAEPRFPENVMHIVLSPPDRAQPRLRLLEIRGSRQGRENREAGSTEIVLLDEIPQSFEV